MTAEGDLVIYGCDDTGKQIFSYTMQEQYRRSDKIQISEGSDNEDQEEEARYMDSTSDL